MYDDKKRQERTSSTGSITTYLFNPLFVVFWYCSRLRS